MERTTMKINESRPSISSLRSSLSSLHDSIEEMARLSKAAPRGDGKVSTKESWAASVKMLSIILQLQAIKELIRLRKEAIPNKGKIYNTFFNFPAQIRIRMMESDVEDLEERLLLMIP